MTSRLLWPLLALTLMGCNGGAGEDEGDWVIASRLDAQGRVVLSSEERAALELKVEAAKQGTLSVASLRFGRLSALPRDDVLIVAPVSGTLGQPRVQLGDPVDAGDVLVELHPLLEAAVRASLDVQDQELQGQIEAAQARLVGLRSERERMESLLSSQLATQAEGVGAEAEWKAQQARIEGLQRARDALSSSRGDVLELKAPLSGVVVELASDPGDMLRQGDRLARVVRRGPRWIDLAVPPDDPTGDSYRVRGSSGLLPARLLARGAVIQPDGTRRDRLELPVPPAGELGPDAGADAGPEVDAGAELGPELSPGAIVAVEVLHERQGTLVAESAVVRRGTGSLVFVELSPGLYQPRLVQVEARDPARVLLLSGVEPGERVVVVGATSLLAELGSSEGPAERDTGAS